MSKARTTVSLIDHFSALKDPRQSWRVVYPLREILLLVLCASLCGMEDFVEIRMWGELRLDFLRRFYPYERGLPAHDTLNDVFNALDPGVFQACFFSVLAEAAMEGRLPRGFCVKRLTDLPMLWSEQWRAIGLQTPTQVRAELN